MNLTDLQKTKISNFLKDTELVEILKELIMLNSMKAGVELENLDFNTEKRDYCLAMANDKTLDDATVGKLLKSFSHANSLIKLGFEKLNDYKLYEVKDVIEETAE